MGPSESCSSQKEQASFESNHRQRQVQSLLYQIVESRGNESTLYLEEGFWFCDMEVAYAAYDCVVFMRLCKLEIS